MYQCTRCGTDVQLQNQLCHACGNAPERLETQNPRPRETRPDQILQSEVSIQDLQGEASSHRLINDFDTILSIRGPQDLERSSGYESTSLLVSPEDQKPQIIAADLDRTEINHAPPSYAVGEERQSQVRSRRDLVTYKHMAEEPIFDQTIAEDPEDYEQMGFTLHTDVIDQEDEHFSDFKSASTEVSELPSVVLEPIESLPAVSSHAPPAVPPPSPSLGGWLNVPNPFAAKKTDPQRSRYFLIDLNRSSGPVARPSRSQQVSSEETMTLSGAEVSWTMTSHTHFMVRAKCQHAPIKSHKVWMSLQSDAAGEITLEPAKLYRCGGWCFTFQSLRWRAWDGVDSLEPEHIPHDATESHASQQNPLREPHQPLIDRNRANPSSNLSLIVYRDEFIEDPERAAHRETQHVTSAQMALFGIFPLRSSAVTRVGGNLCDIVLPLSQDDSQREGPLFTLEITSDSSIRATPIYSHLWRVLSPNEEVPFGAVLSLDRYLFSLINMGEHTH